MRATRSNFLEKEGSFPSCPSTFRMAWITVVWSRPPKRFPKSNLSHQVAPQKIRVHPCPSVVQKQRSGASAQTLDAPYKTTKLFLNEEPRMDADQHGLKRKEETRGSRFGVAGSQKQSVSICSANDQILCAARRFFKKTYHGFHR